MVKCITTAHKEAGASHYGPFYFCKIHFVLYNLCTFHSHTMVIILYNVIWLILRL